MYIYMYIFIDEELCEISDSDEDNRIVKYDSTIVNKVLLNTEPIQSLGSWEKHTKVIVFFLFYY